MELNIFGDKVDKGDYIWDSSYTGENFYRNPRVTRVNNLCAICRTYGTFDGPVSKPRSFDGRSRSSLFHVISAECSLQHRIGQVRKNVFFTIANQYKFIFNISDWKKLRPEFRSSTKKTPFSSNSPFRLSQNGTKR